MYDEDEGVPSIFEPNESSRSFFSRLFRALVVASSAELNEISIDGLPQALRDEFHDLLPNVGEGSTLTDIAFEKLLLNATEAFMSGVDRCRRIKEIRNSYFRMLVYNDYAFLPWNEAEIQQVVRDRASYYRSNNIMHYHKANPASCEVSTPRALPQNLDEGGPEAASESRANASAFPNPMIRSKTTSAAEVAGGGRASLSEHFDETSQAFLDKVSGTETQYQVLRDLEVWTSKLNKMLKTCAEAQDLGNMYLMHKMKRSMATVKTVMNEPVPRFAEEDRVIYCDFYHLKCRATVLRAYPYSAVYDIRLHVPGAPPGGGDVIRFVDAFDLERDDGSFSPSSYEALSFEERDRDSGRRSDSYDEYKSRSSATSTSTGAITPLSSSHSPYGPFSSSSSSSSYAPLGPPPAAPPSAPPAAYKKKAPNVPIDTGPADPAAWSAAYHVAEQALLPFLSVELDQDNEAPKAIVSSYRIWFGKTTFWFDMKDYGVKFRDTYAVRNCLLTKCGVPADLLVANPAAANETNRCFFLSLGVAAGLNPFVLQACFRREARRLSQEPNQDVAAAVLEADCAPCDTAEEQEEKRRLEEYATMLLLESGEIDADLFDSVRTKSSYVASQILTKIWPRELADVRICIVPIGGIREGRYYDTLLTVIYIYTPENSVHNTPDGWTGRDIILKCEGGHFTHLTRRMKKRADGSFEPDETTEGATKPEEDSDSDNSSDDDDDDYDKDKDKDKEEGSIGRRVSLRKKKKKTKPPAPAPPPPAAEDFALTKDTQPEALATYLKNLSNDFSPYALAVLDQGIDGETLLRNCSSVAQLEALLKRLGVVDVFHLRDIRDQVLEAAETAAIAQSGSAPPRASAPAADTDTDATTAAAEAEAETEAEAEAEAALAAKKRAVVVSAAAASDNASRPLIDRFEAFMTKNERLVQKYAPRIDFNLSLADVMPAGPRRRADPPAAADDDNAADTAAHSSSSSSSAAADAAAGVADDVDEDYDDFEYAAATCWEDEDAYAKMCEDP